MGEPASSRSRAGVTSLMVLAPMAAIVGVGVSIVTLLSSLNVLVGVGQVVGYAVAAAFELVPAIALVVIAIAGRRFSVQRRIAAGVFGVLCAAAGLYFTAPLLVGSVHDSVVNARAREQPLTTLEKKYTVSELRSLSADFLARSMSTLDRPHSVRAVGGYTESCLLGNLEGGTLLGSLSGELFFTFDERDAALEAVAESWESMGFEVTVSDGGITTTGGGWLDSAEARWDSSAVDYNLTIAYSSVCVVG